MSALEQVEMAEDVSAASSAPANVVDRLFKALSDGDTEAALACCTADVVFWHSFDQVEQDRAAIAQGWASFFAGFPERRFVDARRAELPDGFVQQHVMIGRLASGAVKGWPVCVVVRTRYGLIRRLEEYIDRAGSYPADRPDALTPGLEPA